MTKQDLQTILNSAYFYLKFRFRTEKEMRKFLEKKAEKRKWAKDLIEKAIEELKQQELIDDKKFIQMFVNDRLALKPKGEYVLKQELLKHGVEKELIDEYFANITINEDEIAYKILLSRWSRFKSLPREKRYQKAYSFLTLRGFSFETIRKTIDKM